MDKKDGRSPNPYTPPSWRGTLFMLLGIMVVLTLLTVAFVSAMSQPGTPNLQLPISMPR